MADSVNVWQNPLQYCKVISLQLIKRKKKKKKQWIVNLRRGWDVLYLKAGRKWRYKGYIKIHITTYRNYEQNWTKLKDKKKAEHIIFNAAFCPGMCYLNLSTSQKPQMKDILFLQRGGAVFFKNVNVIKMMTLLSIYIQNNWNQGLK